MNADKTMAILAFVAFSIPIVGALWKIFTIRERLQTEILSNRHRIDLIEKSIEHLVDQQQLFLNGMQERVQHVRDRSKREAELLDTRLHDVENYLEKSTPYVRRRSD